MNQCDGCQAGIPVDKNGNHRMGGKKGYPNLQRCQKGKYVDEYESKVREAMVKEHKEAKVQMRQELAGLGVLAPALMTEFANAELMKSKDAQPALVIPLAWLEEFDAGYCTYGELVGKLRMAKAALLDLPLGDDQLFFGSVCKVKGHEE